MKTKFLVLAFGLLCSSEVLGVVTNLTDHIRAASRWVVVNHTDQPFLIYGNDNGTADYPPKGDGVGTQRGLFLAPHSQTKFEAFGNVAGAQLRILITNAITGVLHKDFTMSEANHTNRCFVAWLRENGGSSREISEFSWLGWESGEPGALPWSYVEAVDGFAWGACTAVIVGMFGLVRSGMNSWTGLGG